MSPNQKSSEGLFTTKLTPITLAAVVLFALIVLALLRHFFGNIRLELGTK